jgi:hypothetical protein
MVDGQTANLHGDRWLAVGRNLVALEHSLDGVEVFAGDHIPANMFIHNDEITGLIEAAEEGDGVVCVAIVQGDEPIHAIVIIEILQDMDLRPEITKVDAGGNVEVAVIPSGFFPTGVPGQNGFVFRVIELVIVHAGGDEAGVGFGLALKGEDEVLTEPFMAHPTGVGSGVEAGTPIGPGGAQAGADVLIFTFGECGGLLDADDVVFEAEIGINILLVLEMSDDDAGAIFKGEKAAGGVEGIFEPGEEAPAEVIEPFEVGLADFAEEETFQPRHALAIINAHLGNEPVGFAAATGTAIADRGGAAGLVAEAGGGAGGELPGLEQDAGPEMIFHLVERAAGGEAGGGVLLGIERLNHSFNFLSFFVFSGLQPPAPRTAVTEGTRHSVRRDV